MPSARPGRMRSDERGFTLIELLVVIVVIGVLAAIAIPSFLGQNLKAQDASAKSDVKRINQMVEECRLHKGSYTSCDTKAELDNVPGLSWGSSAGEEAVWLATPTSYIVYSVSHAKTGNDNHVYYIYKDADGTTGRACLAGGGPTGGGCKGFLW